MDKEKIYICDACRDNLYTFSDESKNYRWVFSLEKQYKCAGCKKSFCMACEVTEKESPIHTRRNAFHLAIARQLQESSCYDADSRIQQVREESIIKNSNGIPFKYSLFSSTLEYKKVLNHIIDKQNGALKCKECNKCFRSKPLLERHLLTHSNEKPHKCNICSSIFKYKTSLSSHMKKHDDQNPFRCELCKKSCGYASELKIHMAKHSNLRLYECSICSKKFKHKHHLTEHLNLHSKNPFNCKICNKSCISKYYLENHMAKHSDERHHKCRICNSSYKQKSHLLGHMKKHNKEETVN